MSSNLSPLHLPFFRIIEPYSKVQVDYVASKIGLPKSEVHSCLGVSIENHTLSLI